MCFDCFRQLIYGAIYDHINNAYALYNSLKDLEDIDEMEIKRCYIEYFIKCPYCRTIHLVAYKKIYDINMHLICRDFIDIKYDNNNNDNEIVEYIPPSRPT
jgi:hypothetical protein